MKLLHLRKVIFVSLTTGFFPAAQAVDSFSLEAAGGDQVKMLRLGAQWKWERQWLRSSSAHVGGYWNATISHWRGSRFQNTAGRTQSISSIGITPVFRWQDNTGKGLYAEAGIGLRLLSALYDNAGKRLSTRLQFGDHLALGYVFQNSIDVGLKLEHVSNGGLKKPNDGVNFALIRLTYSF